MPTQPSLHSLTCSFAGGRRAGETIRSTRGLHAPLYTEQRSTMAKQIGRSASGDRGKRSCRRWLPKWSRRPRRGVAANRYRQPPSSSALRRPMRALKTLGAGLYPAAPI